MRIKEIKVIARPFEEDFDEVVEAFKRIERREEFEEEKIVVESLDVLRKILTPERLRILQVIKNEEPKSIYELAKLLGRDRAAVIRDLKVLQEIGFVEVSKKKDEKGRKKLVVPYDEIIVKIPVVG